MFVKNAWYIAARNVDVTRQPIQRIVCGNAVVIYRKEDGSPVAMRDQCPHRKFPLSQGRVVGDDIQCMYHGMKFNSAGSCIFVPAQKKVPGALNNRTFPLVERYGWVWVWPGDPELADETCVPDCGVMEQDGWVSVYGDVRVKADYRLILDNIVDLSHVAYVHQGTLGTEEVAEAPIDVQIDDKSVKFQRYINDVPVPKTFHHLRDDWVGNIDRWQKEHYVGPALALNDVRAVPAGTDDESQGFRFIVVNQLTPVNEKETHYHWAVTRGFRADSEEVSEALRGQIVQAFEREDKDVIEAQQKLIDQDQTNIPLRAVNADKTTIGVRRILKKLCDLEANK